MAVNYGTISEKIMRFIQGNGLQVKMFDSSNGKSVADPTVARYFYVDEPNLMIFLDQDTNELKFHIGEGVDIDRPMVDKMIKNLRNLARENIIDFDIREFGKQITPKNYAYKIEQNKEQAMSDVVAEGLSALEGSTRTSRQTLENARIVVKHRKPVNEEQRGSRSRNISAIFIENAEGERFKYPYKHLNGARAMARHVAHGGIPSDMVGEAIVELSSNLYKLKEFMNIVRKQDLINETNRTIVSNVKTKMESIKESIKRIQGNKGYAAFVESMALNENSEEVEISEETVNDYVSKFTKTTFEETLKDILPLVHRVNEEEYENRRAGLLDRVKKIITMKDSEGNLVNTITFPKTATAFDMDKIKNQYRDPKNDAEARQQKFDKFAAEISDLSDRVIVDSSDDKKRKSKGHDRAAEIAMFLTDVAEKIGTNPASVKKDETQVVAYLMKISKKPVQEVTEKVSADQRIDMMISEAFSLFDKFD
jgi:hypothetical protein